jgi:hypothetical protein
MVGPQEEPALQTCGATTGMTEGFLVAGKWSARSWNYACSNPAAAQTALNTLRTFYSANSFTPAPNPPAGVSEYLRLQPNDARAHAEYVSNSAVVVVEVSSPDQATSLDAVSTIITAALKKLPSTFHS